MKKLNPAKFVFAFLGLSTFASLIGTVSGTLAWYAYSTRASLSYSGTSVSSALQLQIGLASKIRMPALNNNKLNKKFWSVMKEDQDMYHNDEDGEDYYCYFADVGVGLDHEVLEYYLSVTGYAADCMMPITSGYYDPDDPNCEFELYKSPSALHYTQDIVSEHENYLKFSFIFRAYKGNTSDTNVYADPGDEIWLVDAVSHPYTVQDGNVYKAMRIFVDRHDDIGKDFIISPMSETSGKTNVGGILDLTNDQYYDYDGYGEILYGDYEVDSGKSTTGYAGPDVFQDIYGLNELDNPSCITSKHRHGVKYYENLNGCTFKTASYLCMDDVRPDRHPVTGVMSNVDDSKPTHVCVTGDAAHNYIGHVDLKLWLEGWDFNAVDDFQMHKFDFGLTFEINKI